MKSIISKRNLTVVLSRANWDAVAPAVASEFDRWALSSIALYGDLVRVSIDLFGSYWDDLTALFNPYVI